MHRYSEEEKKFIIDNNYGKYSKELAEMFNQQFDTNITANEIKWFRKNHKLNSGLTGQFQKGNISHNKGKKQSEYMTKEAIERTKATRFKKGNRPSNYRPVGSERITKDGYIEVKVADPNKWETKNKIVYKQHFGDIPKGYNVIYADGNKLNNDINNLILVSNSELLIANRNHLIYNNKELTESGILISKVIDKTNKVKNERL
ncbi:MAG: HNH endonuclease [Clostridium sp.]|nr:HNH endonuclease [Clostridium sp.]